MIALQTIGSCFWRGSLETRDRPVTEPDYPYTLSLIACCLLFEAAGLKRAEWTHGGLHATFANELTRRRKLYSSFLARDLNVVQDLRHTADYRDSDVSKRQATRALAKAREFVSLTKKGMSNG